MTDPAVLLVEHPSGDVDAVQFPSRPAARVWAEAHPEIETLGTCLLATPDEVVRAHGAIGRTATTTAPTADQPDFIPYLDAPALCSEVRVSGLWQRCCTVRPDSEGAADLLLVHFRDCPAAECPGVILKLVLDRRHVHSLDGEVSIPISRTVRGYVLADEPALPRALIHRESEHTPDQRTEDERLLSDALLGNPAVLAWYEMYTGMGTNEVVW